MVRADGNGEAWVQRARTDAPEVAPMTSVTREQSPAEPGRATQVSGSIIIPAHNESSVISRLLHTLAPGAVKWRLAAHRGLQRVYGKHSRRDSRVPRDPGHLLPGSSVRHGFAVLREIGIPLGIPSVRGIGYTTVSDGAYLEDRGAARPSCRAMGGALWGAAMSKRSSGIGYC